MWCLCLGDIWIHIGVYHAIVCLSNNVLFGRVSGTEVREYSVGISMYSTLHGRGHHAEGAGGRGHDWVYLDLSKSIVNLTRTQHFVDLTLPCFPLFVLDKTVLYFDHQPVYYYLYSSTCLHRRTTRTTRPRAPPATVHARVYARAPVPGLALNRRLTILQQHCRKPSRTITCKKQAEM